MIIKPGCCLPLKFTAKTMALLEFVGGGVGVVVSAGALIYLNLFPKEVDGWFSSTNVQTQLEPFVNVKKLWADSGSAFGSSMLIIALLFYLQKLVLACVLIFAVFQKRIKLLRLWVGYTLALIVFSVMLYLGLLGVGVAEPWSIPFYVVVFMFREYTVWVGYAFLKRVESELASSLLISRGCGRTRDRVVYKL